MDEEEEELEPEPSKPKRKLKERRKAVRSGRPDEDEGSEMDRKRMVRKRPIKSQSAEAVKTKVEKRVDKRRKPRRVDPNKDTISNRVWAYLLEHANADADELERVMAEQGVDAKRSGLLHLLRRFRTLVAVMEDRGIVRVRNGVVERGVVRIGGL